MKGLQSEVCLQDSIFQINRKKDQNYNLFLNSSINNIIEMKMYLVIYDNKI